MRLWLKFHNYCVLKLFYRIRTSHRAQTIYLLYFSKSDNDLTSETLVLFALRHMLVLKRLHNFESLHFKVLIKTFITPRLD